MDKQQENNIVEVDMGVSGVFKAHAFRPSDGRIREFGEWQDNLITNGGMNKLAGGVGSGSFMSAVRVGSGSTAPAFTDTALVAHVASVAADTAVVSINAVAADAAPFMGAQMTYTFPVGAAAGNLTELGLAGNTSLSGYPLYTRALFKDGSGNPVTIVVGADEQLVITYILRLYIPKVSSSAVLLNAGNSTNYTITMLPMEIDSDNGMSTFVSAGMYSSAVGAVNAPIFYGALSGTLGPIDGTPPGTVTNPIMSMTPAAYVPDSYRRDVTYMYALTQANFSDIGTFVHSNNSQGYYAPVRWQWTVSPKITKTNLQTLSFTHRFTLARV